MARRNARHTVYDVMDEKGVFDENPANVQSSAYVRAEYPKMFFHPKGEEKIVRPAEIIDTAVGPKALSELRELIHVIVQDEAGEKRVRAEGWHDHPSKANAAAGRAVAGGISQAQRIAELEKELAVLRGADGKAPPAVNATSTGPLPLKPGGAAAPDLDADDS